MTRTASLARNVFSNWLVLASNIVYAFFIMPIVVRELGHERYGIWSFLNGLLGYTELLYLGLGSAIIKYVAQYRASDDRAGINRLTSVVTSIYSLLGLACLTAFVALSGAVPDFFATPLPPDVARAATITCMLLGIRLLGVFLGSAFAGVLIGHERYDLVNGISIVSITGRFVATPIVVARAADPLLGLAWLTVLAGALEVLVLAVVAFRQVPGLRIQPTRPTRTELRWLYGFGLQSFFILLAVKLISYTDTTVVGLMLGASSVTLYVLPLQLVEYVRVSVGGFASVFLPRVTVLLSRGDHAGVRQEYLRSVRVSCFLSGWFGGLLLTLGPAFLSLWISPDVGVAVRWVLVFLTIASFAQVLSCQVPLAFYQGLHVLAVPAAVLTGEALLNLGLSVMLAPRIGIDGVALATLVPALVSVAVLPPYLCRKIAVPLGALVRQSIAPGVLVMTLTAGAEFALGVGLSGESYLTLALRAAVSVPIAAAVVATMFPADDRRVLWHLVSLGRLREAR